jgi:DDE_Tnp_1-associated
MQYTESVLDCLKGLAQQHPEPIDWQSACEQVKDPRRKQGQRFSLISILLLALAAMLSNHLSELAIAQWGAGQSEEIKKALGFENGVTPHQTTIQRLFRRVSAEELEAALRGIFLHSVNTDQEQRGACAIAIDGKAHRGRLKFEEEHGYAVHAVSLVDHQTGIVLTQGHVEKADVEPKSELPGENEQEEHEAQKQKSELAVACRLIQHIDWKGKVLTGDALYCQRDLCSALRASRRRLSVSGERKSASTV